ncbi:MAG: ATP-binding cassette domain-containing protein [Halanaerobiales bacterium]
MKPVIECDNLVKKYGDFTALNNIDLKLEANKIYGLLGRNGAGKTTFLNTITGHIFANSGVVRINGEIPYENPGILEMIAYVKEESTFIDTLKLKDLFSTTAGFYVNWDEEYFKELLNTFPLNLNKKYKDLSKGMKSTVNIIIGLASRAPITIFDESSMGLDTPSRQLFYDCLIKDFSDNPRTVIFATHLIDEVSKLFEEIIIIDQGEIILKDDVEVLRKKSHKIVGKKDIIEKVFKSEEILYIREFASYAEVFVSGELSIDKRREISVTGLDLSSVTLSELFTYITSTERGLING